jgi:hypothetical protein
MEIRFHFRKQWLIAIAAFVLSSGFRIYDELFEYSKNYEKPELENKNDSLIAVNTTANEELEEILNIKNANIEQLTQELEHFKTKCSLLEKQVEESSLLTVEFSQRIKRLKTEITAS